MLSTTYQQSLNNLLWNTGITATSTVSSIFFSYPTILAVDKPFIQKKINAGFEQEAIEHVAMMSLCVGVLSGTITSLITNIFLRKSPYQNRPVNSLISIISSLAAINIFMGIQAQSRGISLEKILDPWLILALTPGILASHLTTSALVSINKF